jgi:DNA-binding beta-propeller fold protein YncE
VSVLAYPCNPIGDIAVDPTSGTLIATHPRDCTVSIFDADDPNAAAAIRLNGDPVAVTAAVGRAFVAITSASYDAVAVLDMNSKIVVSVHPLAFTVTGIAVSADGARVFAARTGRLGSDVATAEITSIPVAPPGGSSIDVVRIGTNGQVCASVYVADHVGDVTVLPVATPVLQAVAG